MCLCRLDVLKSIGWMGECNETLQRWHDPSHEACQHLRMEHDYYNKDASR